MITYVKGQYYVLGISNGCQALKISKIVTKKSQSHFSKKEHQYLINSTLTLLVIKTTKNPFSVCN